MAQTPKGCLDPHLKDILGFVPSTLKPPYFKADAYERAEQACRADAGMQACSFLSLSLPDASFFFSSILSYFIYMFVPFSFSCSFSSPALPFSLWLFSFSSIFSFSARSRPLYLSLSLPFSIFVFSFSSSSAAVSLSSAFSSSFPVFFSGTGREGEQAEAQSANSARRLWQHISHHGP